MTVEVIDRRREGGEDRDLLVGHPLEQVHEGGELWILGGRDGLEGVTDRRQALSVLSHPMAFTCSDRGMAQIPTAALAPGRRRSG
jgi:hypothetical protein